MYVNDRMRTSASNNGLTIWGKEDSWRLELQDDGKVMRLMHNNYRPLPDGTRIFTKGYHLQAELVMAKHAINITSRYTYEGHKAEMLRREQERLKQQAGTRLQKDPGLQNGMAWLKKKVITIWERVVGWMRKIFHI